jgi:hypothetical protein
MPTGDVPEILNNALMYEHTSGDRYVAACPYKCCIIVLVLVYLGCGEARGPRIVMAGG